MFIHQTVVLLVQLSEFLQIATGVLSQLSAFLSATLQRPLVGYDIFGNDLAQVQLHPVQIRDLDDGHGRLDHHLIVCFTMCDSIYCRQYLRVIVTAQAPLGIQELLFGLS